ncbi:hypothetical protein AB0C84_43525 [Actinomadura sp. NPDC048955]|uniref:hypothetical protein n=1 Tax=Actinomadura sp. NPDC048955 TaxID=3158228 RepID=UPI0033FC7DEB
MVDQVLAENSTYTSGDRSGPAFAGHPNRFVLLEMTADCDRAVSVRSTYMSDNDVEELADALRAGVALAATIAERIPPIQPEPPFADMLGLSALFRAITQYATPEQAAQWTDLREAVLDLDAKYASPDRPEAAAARSMGRLARWDNNLDELMGELFVLAPPAPADIRTLVRFAAEFLTALEEKDSYYGVGEAYRQTITGRVPIPAEKGLHALARRVHQRLTAAGGQRFADYISILQMPPQWRPGDLAQLRDEHHAHALTVRVVEVNDEASTALIDPVHEKYCIGDHPGADNDELCAPNSPPIGEPGHQFKVHLGDLHTLPVGYRPDLDDALGIARPDVSEDGADEA